MKILTKISFIILLLVPVLLYGGSTAPPPPTPEQLENMKDMQVLKDKTELEKTRLDNNHKEVMQQDQHLHEQRMLKFSEGEKRKWLILIYSLSVIAFIIVLSFIAYLFVKNRNNRLEMQRNEMLQELKLAVINSGHMTEKQRKRIKELSAPLKRKQIKQLNSPPKDPKF